MSALPQPASWADSALRQELPRVSLLPEAPDATQRLVSVGPASKASTAEAHRIDTVAASFGWRPPEAADAGDFVRLFQAIGHATGNSPGTIVQFAGCSAGESSLLLAYHTSCIGATLFGKRLLFIDATEQTGSGPARPDARSSKQLYDVAVGTAEIDDAILEQSSAGLCVAILRLEGITTGRMLGAHQIKLVLDALRKLFDVILIASPPVLDQPLSAILTGLVDGSVLILDGEKTRTAAAQQSVRRLTRGGGRIIGAVHDGRRDHLPGWMRRWV